MKTVELKVTGMHCVHCEANVANLLEKVEGVEKAVADRTANVEKIYFFIIDYRFRI